MATNIGAVAKITSATSRATPDRTVRRRIRSSTTTAARSSRPPTALEKTKGSHVPELNSVPTPRPNAASTKPNGGCWAS